MQAIDPDIVQFVESYPGENWSAKLRNVLVTFGAPVTPEDQLINAEQLLREELERLAKERPYFEHFSFTQDINQICEENKVISDYIGSNREVSRNFKLRKAVTQWKVFNDLPNVIKDGKRFIKQANVNWNPAKGERRQQQAFENALVLLRSNLDSSMVIITMNKWNDKNEPPLEFMELMEQVASAQKLTPS